jgi:hypothetical protein
MDNKNLLNESLRSEILQLVKKMESSNDRLPIELGLPKILVKIESEISTHTPNKKNIEKEAYGIFRLVTESYELEKSNLGQELLNLRTRIKEFVSTLDPLE